MCKRRFQKTTMYPSCLSTADVKEKRVEEGSLTTASGNRREAVAAGSRKEAVVVVVVRRMQGYLLWRDLARQARNVVRSLSS